MAIERGTPQQLRQIWRERAGYLELEPEADARTRWLARAWHELNTSRIQGGPIPFDKIDYWADRRGFDDDTAMLFRNVIGYLESEHWAREKGKRDLEAAAAARKARG